MVAGVGARAWSALVVQLAGARWIDALMPPVVTGAIVALIGLNLAPVAWDGGGSGGVKAQPLIAVVTAGRDPARHGAVPGLPGPAVDPARRGGRLGARRRLGQLDPQADRADGGRLARAARLPHAHLQPAGGWC